MKSVRVRVLLGVPVDAWVTAMRVATEGCHVINPSIFSECSRVCL